MDSPFPQSRHGRPSDVKQGKTASSQSFRCRSLLDANPGLHVAWHSDYPWLGDDGPIPDLFSLVSSKELAPDGQSILEPSAWLAAEAVTVEEALRMMTIEGVYALFMHDWVGSLKPGKFADLAVLSDGPLAVPPDELIDLKEDGHLLKQDSAVPTTIILSASTDVSPTATDKTRIFHHRCDDRFSC